MSRQFRGRGQSKIIEFLLHYRGKKSRKDIADGLKISRANCVSIIKALEPYLRTETNNQGPTDHMRYAYELYKDDVISSSNTLYGPVYYTLKLQDDSEYTNRHITSKEIVEISKDESFSVSRETFEFKTLIERIKLLPDEEREVCHSDLCNAFFKLNVIDARIKTHELKRQLSQV